MNKFNARKSSLDGFIFDSQAEMCRYLELKLLQTSGVISELQVHPVYLLIPGFVYKGKKIQPTTYIADFSYTENGIRITEDVKGGRATQTDAWRIKRKLFMSRYPDFFFQVVEA